MWFRFRWSLAVLLLGCATAQSEVIRWSDGSGGSPEPAVLVLHYDGAGILIEQNPHLNAEPEDGAGALVSNGPSGRVSRHIVPSAEVLPAIQLTARRYQDNPALAAQGLSPPEWTALFQALIRVESAYNPAAVSPKGATGLAQLMPATALGLGVDIGDPFQNLDGGARYLLAQMDRFNSLPLALAAYNAGPEAVAAYGGIPPYAETKAYVSQVLAEYEHLRGPLAPDQHESAQTAPGLSESF